MDKSRTIFSQLLDYLPRLEFHRCVSKHNGNHNVRSFSCWDQFLCMMFAQLTGRESLRDIEVCLRGMQDKIYKIGLRGKISKSSLADANDKRPSKIYSDFARVLIKRARKLYAKDIVVDELVKFAFILDSSWIKLCLSLCPWAKFGGDNRAFIKLHTMLDIRGSIPLFIAISRANINDPEGIDKMPMISGAFYIMDKGYFDLARLNKINESCCYFLIRKKRKVKISRALKKEKVDKLTGLRFDRIVRFKGKTSKKKYPDRVRLIGYRDEAKKRNFIFVTNNFQLPALKICLLYKERWNIELFFRWIKQHLRVTRFYGTSLNAIETQIWIATCSYLIITIMKKELKIEIPLYQILQFISVSLFEEKSILSVFSEQQDKEIPPCSDKQLKLF